MDRPFKPKYGTVSQVLLQLVVVNDVDVCVNQLNLDCIIVHSMQIKILLYH